MMVDTNDDKYRLEVRYISKTELAEIYFKY